MAIRQLDDTAWDEPGAPFPICTLPFGPDEISRQWEIQFTEFDDDGLGRCRAAFVKIDEIICLLESHPDGPAEARLVTIFIRSTEADSEIATKQIVAGFGLSWEALRWKSEFLGPAAWALFRVDDNANEFEMQRFLLEVSAVAVRRAYEKKEHKQTYFVRPVR